MQIGFMRPALPSKARFGATNPPPQRPIDPKFAELAGTLLKGKLDRLIKNKTIYSQLDYALTVTGKENKAYVSVPEFSLARTKKMMAELAPEGVELTGTYTDRAFYRFYALGKMKTLQPLNVEVVGDKPVEKPQAAEQPVAADEEVKTDVVSDIPVMKPLDE